MQGDETQMRCRGIDEFQIGDFVWGKIHGNLWWPGQVCDPSDGSHEARNSEHLDHHIFVAYFGGDSTIAWCEASFLKPFQEEFQQMVEQDSSQTFIDAVQDAVYEVERCLRSELTCSCVPPEKVLQFRIGGKNDIGSASVSNYSPDAFLRHLQDVARDISVANMLDVTFMRSWAASFYLRNGFFVKMIEDLFDEKQSHLNGTENLYKDEQGREFQVNCGSVVRRPQISRDEASRKKRSIAELILLADPELLQHSVAEEEKVGALENETKHHINPGSLLNKKGDKEKDKVPDEEENGSTRRERKKSKYLSPPYTSGYKERSDSFKLVDSEASENDHENFLNLQTMFPTCVDFHESSMKEDDPVTRSSIDSDASTHDILAKLLCAAISPLHLARNAPVETVREFFMKHRSFAYSGVLELEGLSKQSGRSRTSGNYPSHDMVTDNNKVSSRRKRNNYKDESEQEHVLGVHENGEKLNKDKATSESQNSAYSLNGIHASKARLRSRGKRNTNEAASGSVEEIDNMVTSSLEEGRLQGKRKNDADVTNGEQKTDFDHRMYDDSGKSVFRSKRARLVEESNENSVALLLTFSPGSALPSKEELFMVFNKYGALIKHETELFRDPGCARVVFSRETDAKKALNAIKKGSNFPFSVVDCQSFDLPQFPDIPSRPESDTSAELISISQELQRMVSTLTPKKGFLSHGLKPEVRKDLINDIKGLLDKVNKFIT